jgi:hypothetical protein
MTPVAQETGHELYCMGTHVAGGHCLLSDDGQQGAYRCWAIFPG